MILRFCLLFLIFLSLKSQAWDASVTPKYRFYSMTGSVAASISEESTFWDGRSESSPYNYGLYRLSLNAGAEGMLEGVISLYPIPVVKLFAAMGGTYRFYNLPTFNCDQAKCSGFLQRARVGLSLLLPFGSAKEWIFIPTYEQVGVSLTSNQQLIADEAENILASASGDTYEGFSGLFGKRIESSFVGVYAKQGHYRNTNQYNEIQLALAKINWSETGLAVGVGRYASSFYVPGITFVVAYEWRWGNPLSLF